MVPYQPALVRLPSAGSSPVDLEEVLHPATLDEIRMQNILADDDVIHDRFACDFVDSYLDVHLRDPSNYQQFIARVFSCGLVIFSTKRRCRISLFFVRKKVSGALSSIAGSLICISEHPQIVT